MNSETIEPIWSPLADPELEGLAWRVLQRIDRALRREEVRGLSGAPTPQNATLAAVVPMYVCPLDEVTHRPQTSFY